MFKLFKTQKINNCHCCAPVGETEGVAVGGLVAVDSKYRNKEKERYLSMRAADGADFIVCSSRKQNREK